MYINIRGYKRYWFQYQIFIYLLTCCLVLVGIEDTLFQIKWSFVEINIINMLSFLVGMKDTLFQYQIKCLFVCVN